MTTEAAPTARERVESGERVVSLSEAAAILGMKRPNTAKFLARRKIRPAFPKAQGYFYWLSEIEEAKRQRDADKAKLEADARRRSSALHGPPPAPVAPPPEVARMGDRQREVARVLLRHPIPYPKDPSRFALRRLRLRGLAEQVPGEDAWQATDRLRELAEWL